MHATTAVPPSPAGKILWAAIAIVGAWCLGVVALRRGEPINAIWLVAAAIAVFVIAYRFYARFIECAVLRMDPSRATPAVLAALQAPQADKALMATFRRQFANADADIDQAVRALMVFGAEYVQQAPEYSPDTRDHIVQAIAAIGGWALAAPLSDPARAQRFFATLSAAAIRSGLDGMHADADFARLGMTQSLNRLSPFFATLLAQLRQQYGLDLDAALRSARVTLLQQTGDTALLRLQYVLAGQPVDARLPVVRIDGHWYLADYVRRAEQSLHPGAH